MGMKILHGRRGNQYFPPDAGQKGDTACSARTIARSTRARERLWLLTHPSRGKKEALIECGVSYAYREVKNALLTYQKRHCGRVPSCRSPSATVQPRKDTVGRKERKTSVSA